MPIHTRVSLMSHEQQAELTALRTGGDPAAWVPVRDWAQLGLGAIPLAFLALLGWGQFELLERWETAANPEALVLYSLFFGYGMFFVLWAVVAFLRNLRSGYVNASFGLVKVLGRHAVIFPHAEIQSVELSQVTTGSMLNDQTIGTSQVEIGGGIRVMHRHRQYSLALIIDRQAEREVIVFPAEEAAVSFQTRLVGLQKHPESVILPPAVGRPGWGIPGFVAVCLVLFAGPAFTSRVFFPWQNRLLEEKMDREVFVTDESGNRRLSGEIRILQEYLRLSPHGRNAPAVASREAELSDARIANTRRALLHDSSYRYEFQNQLREALSRRRVEHYERELAALLEDDRQGESEIPRWRALQAQPDVASQSLDPHER